MKALRKLHHKYRGEVSENEQTLFLQSTNPDLTSYFVEKEGEILKVTKSLLVGLDEKKRLTTKI